MGGYFKSTVFSCLIIHYNNMIGVSKVFIYLFYQVYSADLLFYRLHLFVKKTI